MASTAAYRESVVKLMSTPLSDFPMLTSMTAPVSVLRYHHLGLTVHSVATSIAYYTRLGFEPLPTDVPFSGQSIVRLENKIGMELHLIPSDRPIEEEKNILMDFPLHKPPGHTHASWSVCSVPETKKFLESIGCQISGTRSTLALFTRDPDRTTLEFERNDGGDDKPETFLPEMIGEGY